LTVKLRVLAEADREYAKMLQDFFSSMGRSDYLDMPLDDFLKLLVAKVLEYNKMLEEATMKHEHARNHHV